MSTIHHDITWRLPSETNDVRMCASSVRISNIVQCDAKMGLMAFLQTHMDYIILSTSSLLGQALFWYDNNGVWKHCFRWTDRQMDTTKSLRPFFSANKDASTDILA